MLKKSIGIGTVKFAKIFFENMLHLIHLHMICDTFVNFAIAPTDLKKLYASR